MQFKIWQDRLSSNLTVIHVHSSHFIPQYLRSSIHTDFCTEDSFSLPLFGGGKFVSLPDGFQWLHKLQLTQEDLQTWKFRHPHNPKIQKVEFLEQFSAVVMIAIRNALVNQEKQIDFSLVDTKPYILQYKPYDMTPYDLKTNLTSEHITKIKTF